MWDYMTPVWWLWYWLLHRYLVWLAILGWCDNQYIEGHSLFQFVVVWYKW